MKSITNQPNLYRTEESYYYRKRIPSDLRDILQRVEYKKALRGNYQSAKRKTAFLNSALDKLFDKIRLVKPTTDDIKQIVRNYFEKLLIDAEGQMWLDSEVWAGLVTSDHDGANPEQRLENLEDQLQEVKTIFRRQAFREYYFDLARQIIEAKGFQFYEMSSATSQLYKGLAEADSEALRIAIAARQGESAQTEITHPMFKGCRNYIHEPDLDLLTKYEGLPYYAGQQDCPTLCLAIARHIQFIQSNNYKGNTLQEIENTLLFIPEIIGDKLLSNITSEDCRNLRDCIARAPSHYGKKYKSKGLGLLDVINGKSDYQRLSATTVDKYWQWIGRFFSWCVNESYIQKNPLGQIKVQATKPSIEDRDPFSGKELQAFFSSPQYTGHKSDSRRSIPGDIIRKDGKYWIPLIGLFSGMRLGEIVQLTLSDIRYDEDVPYFDVNFGERQSKSLKNKQSCRTIPIHPDLVKMGLIAMIEDMRTKHTPSTRLFQDVKISAKHGPSHEFSKSFSRYMDQIGLKRDKLVFHSFRHNFVQGMREARIDHDRMDALDGRITGNKGGSNTRRNYGRAFTAKDLYPDLSRIKYAVNLSHLYQS